MPNLKFWKDLLQFLNIHPGPGWGIDLVKSKEHHFGGGAFIVMIKTDKKHFSICQTDINRFRNSK